MSDVGVMTRTCSDWQQSKDGLDTDSPEIALVPSRWHIRPALRCARPVMLHPNTDRYQSLTHVLQQSPRRDDEDVEAGDAGGLLLHVLPADQETRGHGVVHPHFAELLENLRREARDGDFGVKIAKECVRARERPAAPGYLPKPSNREANRTEKYQTESEKSRTSCTWPFITTTQTPAPVAPATPSPAARARASA